MCLIVWKQSKEAALTEQQFRKMLTANADGLGIMFRENGRVVVEKTVAGDNKKFNLWRRHKDKETYAMHSRLKTHGKINLDNCHPYEILNIDKGDPIDLYLMHNGVISKAPKTNSDMSDTWNFVEYVLKPLAKSNVDLLWSNEFVQEMLTNFIGFSKLLLMRSDIENVLILNKQLGDTVNGCWLSNLHSTGDNITRHTNNHSSYVSTRRIDNDNYISWWNITHNSPIIKNETTESKISALEQEWEEQFSEHEDHKNLLLSSKVSDKISSIADKINAKGTKARENHLELMLQLMKSMSDVDMIAAMQEDPSETANIILHFYAGANINEEALIKEIEDDTKVKDTVRLMRQLTSKDRLCAA